MNQIGIPLARQVGLVFDKLEKELTNSSSGIVFLYIRNDEVGKFGVKHDPIESMNGSLQPGARGLSKTQVVEFKQMALEALKLKKGWTHGEIYFEFAIRKEALVASVQFESNYNMIHLLPQAQWVAEQPTNLYHD